MQKDVIQSAMPCTNFLFMEILQEKNYVKTEVFTSATINPFIFIRNKYYVISSEGLSAMICLQRAVLPIQSGITTRSRQ
jgi:hypothetical protein